MGFVANFTIFLAVKILAELQPVKAGVFFLDTVYITVPSIVLVGLGLCMPPGAKKFDGFFRLHF